MSKKTPTPMRIALSLFVAIVIAVLSVLVMVILTEAIKHFGYIVTFVFVILFGWVWYVAYMIMFVESEDKNKKEVS